MPATVKITTLSENTVAMTGCLGEWGLSFLVEVDGYKVLFDTGGGFAVTRNADILGVNLSSIDKIVLSHGHGDHTGGLREVLIRTGKKEIIAHPGIWNSKYVKRPHLQKEAYIGIPFTREELESLGADFKLERNPIELTDTIFTTGEVPMVNDYEKIEGNLFVKENGQMCADTIPDDLSLVVKTARGLLLISGCAHRGIINTINHAQQITGEQRVYAVIGGIHLFAASDERLEKTISALKTLKVDRLGVSHCTGFEASKQLAVEFKGIFFPNNAGMRFYL